MLYENMTVPQLQAEIARMQAEVSRRVCGDQRVSVTRRTYMPGSAICEHGYEAGKDCDVCYARWKAERPNAELTRQVACNEGLGVTVSPAPIFGDKA